MNHDIIFEKVVICCYFGYELMAIYLLKSLKMIKSMKRQLIKSLKKTIPLIVLKMDWV